MANPPPIRGVPLDRVLVLLAVAAGLASGCGSGKENPSFALSPDQASAELRAMQDRPKPLARPVVVVDGYLDPGIGSSAVCGRLSRLTPDPDQVVAVNLFWCATFDEAREKIVRAVEARFPSDDPARTREVDVVGISMGGLAARYAALPADAPDASAPPASAPPASAAAPATPAPPTPAAKRLRIARLFTLATPHRGAVTAALPTLLATQRDMRSGSAFLARLNDAGRAADYPIVPYARLADEIVGESRTAPPGQTPIWMPKGFLEASHFGISMDARVAADIGRRLRGEQPFATEPRAPLPD